jgi:hypothetical protein
MRSAAGALLVFASGFLAGPPLAEALAMALPPGVAGMVGFGLARAMLPLARKLQSEEGPGKNRCPPRKTSSPH